jgi:hypothetical protein
MGGVALLRRMLANHGLLLAFKIEAPCRRRGRMLRNVRHLDYVKAIPRAVVVFDRRAYPVSRFGCYG